MQDPFRFGQEEGVGRGKLLYCREWFGAVVFFLLCLGLHLGESTGKVSRTVF